MKRSLVLILAVMFVLGMVSCKKDYTCTCTIAGQTVPTEYMDVKKKDAEDACDAAQTAARLVDPNANCSL